MLHSACVNVMPTARTLPLCAVVGTLRLKSNGESKIVIFKARPCCGFAIALRALFLGILRFYCHCEALAEAINRVGHSKTFDCFARASLAMTLESFVIFNCFIFGGAILSVLMILYVRPKSHLICNSHVVLQLKLPCPQHLFQISTKIHDNQ